jgi:hypothetical protein
MVDVNIIRAVDVVSFKQHRPNFGARHDRGPISLPQRVSPKPVISTGISESVPMPPLRNYQDRLPFESDDFEKTWNEASLPFSKSEAESQMDQNAAEAIAIL